MKNENDAQNGHTLAAVCGLYCRAYTLYIGSTEDPDRLKMLTVQFASTPEKLRCFGCRSDRLGIHCRDCSLKACATAKGTSFCGECDEYPCAELADFRRQMPHRIELWGDLGRIKEAGVEVWMREKQAEYACPSCNSLATRMILRTRSTFCAKVLRS